MTGVASQSSASRTTPGLFRTDRVLFVVLGVVIAYLALVPLGFLLYTTFFVDGALTLDNFRSAFGSVDMWVLSRNTVVYALGSALFSITVGTTLAYVVVRTNAPFRGLVFMSALVPLIMPIILHTLSWLFLGAERTGWINAITDYLFGVTPFNIQSLPGMI